MLPHWTQRFDNSYQRSFTDRWIAIVTFDSDRKTYSWQLARLDWRRQSYGFKTKEDAMRDVEAVCLEERLLRGLD